MKSSGLELVAPRQPAQRQVRQAGDRRPQHHGGGRDGGEQAHLRGIEDRQRRAERHQHEGELAGAGEHRPGAQRIGAGAGRAKQQEHDPGLEHGQDDGGAEDQRGIVAHDVHVDGHADAHEEQRQQEAAERLDIGFELVPVVGFGEQDAGQEGAERHRHAGGLHDQRGAEHDQEGGRGHDLARAG